VLIVTKNYAEHAAGGGGSEDDALTSFRYAIPSKGTEQYSIIRLRYFFNFHNIPGGDDIHEQAKNFLAQVAENPNPKYGHECLLKFSRHLKDRFENKELKGGTVRNYLFAPKLFYEVNDIKFDWRQIKRGLSAANYIAHDRAPNIRRNT
jgi:hypothetical protein